MMPSFTPPQTSLEAQAAALKLAFGPIVFQCVRIAWKSGLLSSLEQSDGLDIATLARRHNMSEYAVSVLLESCLSAQVVAFEDEKYTLTKVGYFVLHDAMSKINFDFVHDVCYLGLYALEESLRQEKPLGLKTLGDWSTLYEGLTHFPEPAKSSWYAFDHLYSDSAFASLLPLVFSSAPQRLMDIGANTGNGRATASVMPPTRTSPWWICRASWTSHEKILKKLALAHTHTMRQWIFWTTARRFRPARM